MIVVCGNCDTRFQLDDARVPEAGIRVRCSRCKEAFFLKHPSASQAEAADAIAADAASGAAGPGLTQDLPVSTPMPHETGSGIEEEESDWEFNDDDFGAGEPSETGSEAPTDLSELSSPALSIESAAPAIADGAHEEEWLSDGFDSEAGASAVEPAASGNSIADELSASPMDVGDSGQDDDPFGAVEDFSSLADPADDPSRTPEAVAAPVAQPMMQDGDLDDPEDWDFFSDESLAATRASTSPPEAAAAQPQDLMSASSSELATRSFDLPATPLTADPASEAAERFGRAAGWGLTLALLLAGIVNGLLLESPLLVAGPEVVALGGLQARGLEGRWVERAHGRTIYVVRGELHNPGARRVVPGAELRIAIAAKKGQSEVATGESLATAVAGMQRTARELREIPWAELVATRQRAASALSWSGIPAGGSLPFEAVFEEVPADATRFSLMVAPAARPLARRSPPPPVAAASPAEPAAPSGAPTVAAGRVD